MNPFTPKPLPTIPSAVYTHVQLHLRTSIGNPNLPSHVASEDSVLLVEGYISFISKYLENNSEDDIFKAYRLCLAYLKPLYAKGAMVGKKPNSTPLDHRFNLMSCYLRAKKYDNATDHGYILLKDIKEFLGQSWEVGSLVPKLGESAGSCDKQVVALVVNVVRFMLDCNLKFDGSRDVETYNHLLSMIKDIGPWIGLIEKEEDRKKINIDLGRLIKDSTLLLITRLKLQVVKLLDVALLFCKYTFAHQATSNLNDEMYKTGVDILDLCFSTSDLEFQHTKLIIQIVLDALADECKVNQNYGKFLSLVNSCTDQFCIVTNNQKKDVASLFNSLAEKQFFPEGISLVMKLYAIGIVISEDDSCDVQEVFNLLGSTLTRLKCTDMHQELATGAKKLLCARLPVMIMSKSKQITDGLIEDSDPVNLSTIEELLYSDIKGVGDNAGNKQHILALVGACFILSVITKENIKSIDALRKLTADSQSQVDMWKFLSPRLYDVSLTLYKAKRIQEATDSLKLFCEAAWNRVLNFCRMFASRNSDEDFLDETIVGFVQEACKVTICMLSIIEKSDEMHNMLTFVIKKWSKAQSYFPIPPPVELIKQWVQIQCEQIKDPKTLELPPPRTIYSFMPPTCSKEICNIILEQELQGFQDNKMMRDHITKILGENMDRTHYRLKRSKTLVECGMQLRACGTKGLNDCIKYITDAIEIMMSIGKGEGDHQLLWHLMAEAHCLLALCSREARPMSKDYIDHLDEAFMLWQNQECPPDKKTHEKEDFQIHNLTLMFYVADLLLLEGDMEHHSTIIKIIITLLVSKGYSLGECFDIFWRSRQVGCVSTINDAFIKILEDQNESLEILYSKTCINSKAMKVGFQLSLGVVSTFSSFDSCNADDDIHPQITTKEVEDVVSSLIKDV